MTKDHLDAESAQLATSLGSGDRKIYDAARQDQIEADQAQWDLFKRGEGLEERNLPGKPVTEKLGTIAVSSEAESQGAKVIPFRSREPR